MKASDNDDSAPPAAVKLVELSAMPDGAELCVVMRRGVV